MRSASPTSIPASANPYSTPDSQAFPTAPPPPKTNARFIPSSWNLTFRGRVCILMRTDSVTIGREFRKCIIPPAAS